MKQKIKIGLLPLYLKLYADNFPEDTKSTSSFSDLIASVISKKDVEVVKVGTCFTEVQFMEAVKHIEEAKVDALVTLHLAYSPSLESIKALTGTKLPVIVLNTTPGYAFDKDTIGDAIMGNHGIHGVQDMCNMLGRYGKDYFLESGHWKNSDVLDRVIEHVKGAYLAAQMKKTRTGIIGAPFNGMGDFSVPFKVLKDKISIEIIEETPEKISSMLPGKDDRLVSEEIRSDIKNYRLENVGTLSHTSSVRIGLALRKWIEDKKLDGYSIDFSGIDKTSGFPAFPFLEASKAMARGIGYAGEGDVITASLVGTLMKIYPESSFTEMFCPDWQGDRVFLSHMGEANPGLLNEPLLIEKSFPFMDLDTPVMAVGQFKSGEASIVNLGPSKYDSFRLIICKGKIEDVKETKIKDTINGWFKPQLPLEEFLTEYSNIGGTHHSCLVYGSSIKAMETFGKIMGWEVYII